MDAREVIEWRLAVQHLTGEPTSIAGYVHEALAVQSQDPGTARWSVGVRTGANDAQVRAAIDAGEILRTHMLRPTWHFVHRDDLRWLQRLTGGKVASSMPARYRQLGI
ncbi:MAG: crosslink repair DNA glycosylase YcaQ family protein [Pirellulales bacterium]